MPGMCDGLRVIEVSQGMAGGLAGMILADAGAEVIKVEPPSGDRTRAHPAWIMWNRGKKSVVLDLKTSRRAGGRTRPCGDRRSTHRRRAHGRGGPARHRL